MCEPDDSPHRPAAGLADAFNPVIPVLKYELAAAISDDHGRWVPTFFSELLDGLNSVIPILVSDRAEDRVARRPGESLQLAEG